VPTYQYACKACDHRFEAVQSFTDSALTDCPACSGPLRKVFNSVGIVFKGSGFYRTDSRASGGGVASESAKSDSGKNDSGKSDSGSKGDSAKSDTSSGSKPESSSSSGSSGSSGSGSSSSGTPAAKAS
jgi:putative FmdB family regulatory protein